MDKVEALLEQRIKELELENCTLHNENGKMIKRIKELESEYDEMFITIEKKEGV